MPQEQGYYKEQEVSLQSFNKAAEVLWKTLPYMPDNSVFGVILPQGFLHTKNCESLRELLLRQFHLREICSLPENVFASARHKSVVLLGKKLSTKVAKTIDTRRVRYVRINRRQLKGFIDCYDAQCEEVPQLRFSENEAFDLRLPLLDAVWTHCKSAFDTLATVADGGKGLEYKGKHLPTNSRTISDTPFKGAVRGFATFPPKLRLVELPHAVWLNTDPDVIRRPLWGTQTGTPQIIMNYARTSSGPWRIKALIDKKGHPVTSRFLVFRPKYSSWSLKALWAILNSPISNAFMFCNSMERDNLSGTVRRIPIPPCDEASLSNLKELVDQCFALYTPDDILRPDVDETEAAKRMLAVDAEVMRLYDLPPEHEKQVLDLFSKWERPGVDFAFRGYYPEGFDSYIPLHILISPEYQMSTAAFATDWVEKHRSPEVCKALENAAKAFKE